MKPDIDNTVEVTPELSFKWLRKGHERFISGRNSPRNLLQELREVNNSPRPFATVLSCIDSRTPVELIFDQGIGDIFSIRVAGNVVSSHILGSLEYTITDGGSKMIMVMGHTNCGAVRSACNHLLIENFSVLLGEIKPCISRELTETSNRSGENESFVNKVSVLNVYHSIQQIQERSSIIRQYADSGKIIIVPAMYNTASGTVAYYNMDGRQ
jgi:carbonic anhydrase